MINNNHTKINLRDIYGPGFTRQQYLAALAAGYETGFWDDRGIPAPWPDNFDEDNNNSNNEPKTIPDPGQPPF